MGGGGYQRKGEGLIEGYHSLHSDDRLTDVTCVFTGDAFQFGEEMEFWCGKLPRCFIFLICITGKCINIVDFTFMPHFGRRRSMKY